jgi:hypothetical protein
VLTAVVCRDNKGTISSAERVSRGGKVKRARHGIGEGAVRKCEPAMGADKIAKSGGVEKAAVQSPGRGATIGSSSHKGRSVVVRSGARDGNQEDEEVVVSNKQLNSSKGLEEPGQGGMSTVSRSRSRVIEVNAVKRRQDKWGWARRCNQRTGRGR